ncbi:Putative Function: TNA1 of S. cerevisiae is a high affinity plasma membrane permease [Penicillium brasilianum]|uniref:Putative Function: TNA1 of S. cerevisiae is a high affinity plasma membrane permease n=1 Tax=Penicillium brasilianum TaxID=104259 RepID=A0A0F7TL26_PENBI|nr:Putative Function: TNA1 of S. cerevisiae is a high affinity plasma membrane permease [Penicillium brasilianum]
MHVPSNLMLNYMVRQSLYLGFFITAWELVSALTSQVKGYVSIVACRFLLGLGERCFLEAPFFAGFLFYLSKRSSSVNCARCTTSSCVISAFLPIVSKSEMTPVVGAIVEANYQQRPAIEK